MQIDKETLEMIQDKNRKSSRRQDSKQHCQKILQGIGRYDDKVCELPAMSGLYVSPTLRLFHILPLSCQSVSLCNEEGYAPLAYLTGIRFISTFLPLTIL